jgi:chemotaxis protein MotB
MRKIALMALVAAIGMTSCVSKKKYTSLQDQQKQIEADLSQAKMELANCLEDKKKLNTEVDYLRANNNKLLDNMSEMVIINRKEAENLERSLENIKEKDMRIKRMADARTKKDSVTLALVTSLKGVLGNMDDQDIQISVEKGVVFISLSDKLLFKSGSYELSGRAKEVLGKVAKVVNNKPGMDVMVEGHTDDKAVLDNPSFKDNWDLSAKRATTVVRTLQNDFSVAPERLIAAGRSSYVPVADNTSAEGRSANRRTRIIILPKLNEFYGMIEDEMAKK